MIKWIARQKFRYDLGQGSLQLVQFAFILIAASDKIATLIHIPAKVLILVLVPLAIFGVWTVGYILDRLQFYHSYTDELNKRNEMLAKALSRQSPPLSP